MTPLALLAAVAATAAGVPHGGDWTRFGYDAARSNSGPASTGITAANVRSLRRQAVVLDGTVDSSPVYVRNVGGRDLFVVTTTYGITQSIDADTGAIVWRYRPPDYASFAGTAQITTASPVVDPSRRYVYAASPDGHVAKLALATGQPVWSTAITLDPTHEKIGAALNFSRGMVIATTGGYAGDVPPYQGHVVELSGATGAILAVWNSLCSDRAGLIQPGSCASSDSGIWARSGAVVEPRSGDVLVATGNGAWNGRTDWGDSMLLLSPTLRPLGSWTPADQQRLDDTDADLGSTAPALLAGGYAVQGGKDGLLRLLRLSDLPGRLGSEGGEVQTVRLAGGGGLYAAPAVWRGTWVFVATNLGTQAWRLVGGRLRLVWQNDVFGTSAVLAGGLLYVYDAGDGGLAVYVPTTGRRLVTLPAGRGHWQSPIVTDGRIALAEGDANEHALTGVLDVYRLPSEGARAFR